MNVVGAIVRRELHVRVRRKGFYLGRMVFVLLAVGVVLVELAVANQYSLSTTGLRVVTELSTLLMVAACFAAPWSAAPLIAQEKEDRTLGLLLLAEARPWEILFGKLFPTLFRAAVTVLSGLPLLVLCVGLGGISTEIILADVALLLGATFLGTCLGLGISTLSGSGRRALLIAVLVSVLLFGGAPAALESWRGVAGCPGWIPRILPVVSPFHALTATVGGTSAAAALWNCAFNVAVALPLLVVAAYRIPRLALETEGQATTECGRVGNRLALRGNPVAWKERVSSLSARTAWLLCALTSVVGILGARLLADSAAGQVLAGQLTGTDAFRLLALWAVAVVSAIIFILGVISGCAMSFGREKRAHTLDLLLVTALSEQELGLGKLWAAIRVCLPWLIGASIAALPLWFSVDFESKHKMLLPGVYLSLVFGTGCLALYFSLRFRTSAAVGLTALIGIPWVMIVSTAALGIVGAAAMVAWNLAWSHLFLEKLFHRLRQLSAGEKSWV